MLTGGFVNDVFSFELRNAPEAWSGRLVLRLFEADADPKSVLRECVAQRVVRAQGLPAPRVLACEATPEALGRPFMIMEFLPGRPQMIIAFPQIVIEVPRLFTLPRRHARAMNMVHSLDATPMLEAFEENDLNPTLGYWLEVTERTIDRWHFADLRPGLEWLRAHAPEVLSPTICHGDLFGANILEVRGRVTGIIDWVLVTVAEPAFDLGGQMAAYEMSATPGPRAFQLFTIAFGRLLSWGLRGAYRKYRRIPRARVRYYAAMRAFMEMTYKLSLIAESSETGVERRMPTWNPAQCARYFRRRTGVRLNLPR